MRMNLSESIAHNLVESENRLDQVNKNIKGLHEGVLNETVPFNVDIEDCLEKAGSYGWTVKPGSEDELLNMLDYELLNVDLVISEYFSEKYPEISDKCKGIIEKLDSIRDDLRNIMK